MTNVATKLNDYENYETRESYEMAMTQKIFVLNFITSYLPIFLTAFVYVPFAGHIVPYLDIFSLTVKPFATHEKQMANVYRGLVNGKITKALVDIGATHNFVSKDEVRRLELQASKEGG